ncbi:hypothetical protein HPB49_004868 [Dermacentor silvarum]|uniref:Uncharacterized protein n=1 Tax=Dermacentor silvarum TaxID=543639 RepID=A0ACB8DUQ6_DERSI|nr:hypothetical protein HPB49_004868 [Dermacentor silvarum]
MCAGELSLARTPLSATAAVQRARPSAPTEIHWAPRSSPRDFAGAVMELVSVEGEEMQLEEFGKESGWCEVIRGAKNRCSGEAGMAGNKQQGRAFVVEAARNKWKNERNVRQIIKAKDYRAIVRPRGGLNISGYKLDHIYCCLRNTAGVSLETAQEDSIDINSEQNILVLSMPSEDWARKYGAINKLRFGKEEFEASVYRALPDNTSKGLIQGGEAGVCPNPEDKICRGCGCKTPQRDLNCEAECELCGKHHITGDKKCKARYKIPYLVRRRR